MIATLWLFAHEKKTMFLAHVNLELPKSKTGTTIMLNTGAFWHYVSYKWLLLQGWTLCSDNMKPLLQFIDGQLTLCYARKDFDVDITNLHGQTHFYKLCMNVINMMNYDIFIEWKWLCNKNPNFK